MRLSTTNAATAFPDPDRGLKRTEIVAWCVAALICALLVVRFRGIYYDNDSYQYLSIASNLREYGVASSNVIFYDQQRAPGVVPAPTIHFPPGYPWAVSLVSRLGVSVVKAGFVVSILAFLIVVVFTARAAESLALPPRVTRVVLTLLITNSSLLTFAAGIMSELLFLAFSLGSVLLLLTPRPSRSSLMICGVMIGCACWIRYSGLFLFIAVAVYYIIWLRNRSLLLILPAAALLLVLFARNIWLADSWSGEESKAVFRPAWVPKAVVGAFIRMLFGGNERWRIVPCLLLLGMGIFLLACRFEWKVSRQRALIAFYIASYTAAFVCLWTFKLMPNESRYFLPLLPFLLLLGGGFISNEQPRAAPIGVVLVLAGYLSANAIGLLTRVTPLHETLRQGFSPALVQFLQVNVPEREPLLASNGQATAYALNRPVVCIPPPDYSKLIWDENTVRATMDRFHAKLLIIYPSPTLASREQWEWPFLANLVNNKVPDWLELAAENPSVRIYQRR